MSNNGLLPPNATPQEIALAETVARISDVPVLVRQSHDPATCPAQLLPWLAWAYSVDEWDPNWTEAEKRGVIANSLYVHQHKGTIGAVTKSLEPLGYTTEVTEWFEASPPAEPYTFSVELATSDKPIDDALYAKAERLVKATKNERSQLTSIKLRTDIRGNLRFGATTVVGEEITVYPYSAALIEATGPRYFAAACQTYEMITVGPQT